MIQQIIHNKAVRLFLILSGFFIANALIAEIIGVKIFSNPMIQLGDVVEVVYKNNNGVDEATLDGNRFIVYSIEYSRDSSGPDMTLYLSEVK
jgi:hypothetical protein